MDWTITHRGKTGSVWSSQKVSVYVPDDLEMPDSDAVEQARNISLDTPDGVVRLESIQDEARSYPDRAALLTMLYDQVGEFDFRHDDVVVRDPAISRIPVQIAANGKAAIACYLAVHGLNNSQVADLLDVGSRTVSQYISDFQKGER